MARTKVTISLIREGIENINEIVQIDKCEHQEINGVGVFFYKRSAPQSPSWLGFFEGLLQEEQLCNSFAQGLLVVSRTTVDGNRFFAISFGYGRNLLQPNIIDSRFGLITALNSIDEKQLRSLDINTLESVPKIDRVQSSRLTEMNEFDVDQERDLLRSVTGKTSTAMKDHFGNTVTGASSLNISTEKTITNIGDLLDICYIQYKSITYRNHFEWIDTLLPVKDVNLINHLDTMVMSTLNGEYRDSVWMAIPAVLDWNNQFTIHLGQRNYTSDDLLIDEVIEKVYDNRKDLTVSDLKSKRVKIKDAGGAKIGNWSYYDCLYGEVDYNNKFYILNEGKWYNVQDNYKQIILDYYDNAPYPTVNLIDSSKTETEADYNIKLAYSSPDFLLMDKKLVSTGVSHNSIEVCDVYSKNKILIHVKKGHSSSVLSHLFNQGFVSAELLVQLPFRRKFNEKINQVYPEKLDVDDWKVPEDHSFRTNEYSVVYGIITERDEARPHMPFFSKVAFRHFSQTLTNMGYHVYLGNIYAH